MITALAFTLFNFSSYFLALYRAPFWGLIAYMNIYFNTPNPRINWWANYLPFDRWSLVTTAVLILSLAIHWRKTSNHEFESAKWMPWFFVLSAIITFAIAVNKRESLAFLYLFFTYGLIVFVIVKSLVDLDKLRMFLLFMIGFTGYLSVMAYRVGERVNGRLEQFGAADANGSNEFSLLLAGILPFMFAFLRGGKTYERIICIAALPFVVNAFILCNSRGSTVALGLAMVGAMMLFADKEMRRKLIVVAILALPAGIYLADDEFVERFTSLTGVTEAVGDEDTAEELSSGRTEIWRYGLVMAKDNPLGTGPNGFKELAHVYMPDHVLTFKSGNEYGRRSAHNTYLQVLVEQGILGLILWGAMIFHTCLILYKSFKITTRNKALSPFWKDNVFAFSVSFLAVLAGGMINSRVYFEFFWWQIALAAVVYSLMKSQDQDAATVRQS